MIENFQAIIGAKISEFQRKMKQVDKQVRETAFEATKPIGADIKEFQTKMAKIQATSKRVLKRDEKSIGADISRFLRKAAEVAVVARALTKDKIIVPIQASWRNYQNVMGRIASFNRAMEEIMQMTSQGIMISFSPSIVPIIASLVGLLGQLGPMLGTIAGSTFALGTAFATAGIGAAAFGAIALTNIKGIFDASSQLKSLQDKLADASTLKERAKIMKQISSLQKSMNKEQVKALTALNKLKDTWAEIASGLETKTIQMFTKSLEIFTGILETLKPMFTSVTAAVGRLTDSFGQTIKSDSMYAFFTYLNTTAGPMLETMSKAVGNFFLGFINMIVAFGPLATDTANGFLKMSEGFANWSAGLGKSKKFQAFVDYVKENMPKIRSIFSDAIQGIINTFAAFAPSSADMMTGLEDMMERFKNWSSSLSQNQGFQNFVSYVKENGPKVVDLIGNLTTFLVNLGVALAPVGSYMLDLINRFLEWSSAMIENKPWVGKIIAAVLILGGAFFAILPHIVGLITLLGSPLIAPMIAATGRMILTAATFVGKWALMGLKAIAGALEQAAAWLLATGPSMAKSAGKMITTSALFVANWVRMGVQALLHAAKQAAAWTLATGAAMARSVGQMIATSAIFVAKWVWMGVQAMVQAARMAAAWFIAMGPVGWIIGAIVGLAILIIANWDKIKTKTKEIWTKVSNSVKEAWQTVKQKTIEAVVELGKQIAKMPGKVLEFRNKMVSAGADLISGVIKGITGKIGEGLTAIGGFAKGLLSRFKKDTQTKSPSRAFSNISKWFAPGVVKGIDKTKHLAFNAVSDMASRLTNAFSPQLAMADMQASATLNTSLNRSDMKAVKHSFAAEIGSTDVEEPDTYLVVDGKELGRIVAGPVKKENERNDEILKLIRG